MAITTGVLIGLPITLTQNAAYALPGRVCVITSSAACDVSMDGSTGWTAFTSGGQTGANFIRSTLVGTIISCKY